MKSAMTWIAGAHAAMALGALIAVFGVSRSLDEIQRFGGIGFPDVLQGIADAARWPIAAAWIAAGMSLVALVMLRRGSTPNLTSARTILLAAIAIAASVTAVLVFRGTAAFIAYGHLPPGAAVGWTFRALTFATAAAALCFAAAASVTITARRARVSMRAAIFAIVISLGVSTAMIVTLRDLSARMSVFPLR